MVRPVVSPLEHRPEGLHAVDVCLISDILPDGVSNTIVWKRQTLIGAVIVRVDRCSPNHPVRDEPLKRVGVCRIYDLGADFVGSPILCTSYSRLTYRTSPFHALTLRLGHIPPLAADICLIDF